MSPEKGRHRIRLRPKRSIGRGKFVLLPVLVMIMGFMIAGATSSAQANGDNGSIKTHNVGTSTDDVNDEPKLACDGFYLDAFGFDNTESVSWWITEDSHGDTLLSGNIALDENGHGYTGTLNLTDGMYKLYWTFDGQNGEAKHKVFKVEGCEEPPPPEKTAVQGDVQFTEGSAKCITDVVVYTPPSYTVGGSEHVVYDNGNTTHGTHGATFGQTVTVDATGVDDPTKYELTGQTQWTHKFADQPAAPTGCGTLPPPSGQCPRGTDWVDGNHNGVVEPSLNECHQQVPPDICPNIDGYQSSIPPGHTLVKGKCVKQHADAPKSPPMAQPVPETGA